jgi:putative chitinase
VDIKTPAPAKSEIDWAKVILQAAPDADVNIVNAIAEELPAMFETNRITTPLRQAHFLAQATEETDQFATLVEYGDRAYFKRYDGRKDLGNTYPGDGYKFRGRGIFQLTGRGSYKVYGLEKTPDDAAMPKEAVKIAGSYWTSHHLNVCADHDDVIAVTRAINGGTNGLSSRKAFLLRYKHILGVEVLPQGIDSVPVPPKPSFLRALLYRLFHRGYFSEMFSDGAVTSHSVAAFAAFQHDNDLPISGQPDDATMDALFSSDAKRPVALFDIPTLPVKPSMVLNAQLLQSGAVLTAAVAALTQFQTVSTWIDTHKEAFAPVVQHPMLAAGFAAIYVAFFASQVIQVHGGSKK